MCSQKEIFLFDLDGTLVDTAIDLHNALNVALKLNNFKEQNLEVIKNQVGHGARKMILEALSLQGVDKNDFEKNNEELLNKLHADFLIYYGENIANFSKPFDGVVDVLDELKNNDYPLAVVTNKHEKMAIDLLQSLNMLDYFGAVIGGNSLPVPKPSERPLIAAISRLGLWPSFDLNSNNITNNIKSLDKSKILMVGDSETDAKAARNFGCPVWLVKTGYTQIPVEQIDSDKILHHFKEVLLFLSKNDKS